MAELIPIANLRGPQGSQGPAGLGWGATTLGEAHLDTITSPGTYYQNSSGRITPEKGYPAAIAGASGRCSLVVKQWGGGGAIIQVLTTIGSPTRPTLMFTRYCESGTFQSWDVKTSQRVDNTAGRAIYAWDETANREQLIYGDTGLRNISADMTGIQVATGNSYSTIRRENNTVTLCINGAVIAADVAGSLEFYRIPSGFQNTFQQINVYAAVRSNPLTIKSMQLVSKQYVRLYQDPATGDQIRHTFVYQTNDPWPTTLPGVAVA